MRLTVASLIVVSLAFTAGCPGVSLTPNGGTAGSTVAILPDSITLDVDELAATNQSAAPMPSPSLSGGSSPLEVAQSEADRTMAQLDEIMLRFAIINSMVTSAADVQVSGTIMWDTRVSGSTVAAGGSRLPNPGSGAGVARDIKVDFSAFDYDGDGTADGSGTPTTAPVAMRVWVTDAVGTFQPAACGLIDVLPTALHPGAGHLITLSYARNGDGDIAILEWDQDDPTVQTLSTWDEHPEGIGWGYSSFWVQHETVLTQLQKSVASTIGTDYVAATWYELAPAAAAISHMGTWADYLAHPPVVQYEFFVSWLAATATDAQSVDVTNLECIESPDPADFIWPLAFPVGPTF